MESTKQITKAMEMVAASKLRRAQAQILSSRPYFEILYSTIQDITRNNKDFSSPYLKQKDVKKVMPVAGLQYARNGSGRNFFGVPIHLYHIPCIYSSLPVSVL